MSFFSVSGFLGGEKKKACEAGIISPPKKPEALKGHLRNKLHQLGTWCSLFFLITLTSQITRHENFDFCFCKPQ